MSEEQEFLQILPATQEDLNCLRGRKADPLTEKAYDLVDKLEVNEKFYVPRELKDRIVTYCNRTYHKKENNTRYYKIKQVIKDAKYMVIRIS